MVKKKSSKEKTDTPVVNLFYQAIVIGASAGGFEVFTQILPQFDKHFSIPVIVVQHLHPDHTGSMATLLNERAQITIKEADEKEPLNPGHIYFAPANYHLLIEKDKTFSLSIDAKVNYSRPSIDVLFESAVNAFRSRLVGLLLSGANSDGAAGLRKIKNAGGITIVQNPETAYAAAMPGSAMALFNVDYVLNPDQIVSTIMRICERKTS